AVLGQPAQRRLGRGDALRRGAREHGDRRYERGEGGLAPVLRDAQRELEQGARRGELAAAQFLRERAGGGGLGIQERREALALAARDLHVRGREGLPAALEGARARFHAPALAHAERAAERQLVGQELDALLGPRREAQVREPGQDLRLHLQPLEAAHVHAGT